MLIGLNIPPMKVIVIPEKNLIYQAIVPTINCVTLYQISSPSFSPIFQIGLKTDKT